MSQKKSRAGSRPGAAGVGRHGAGVEPADAPDQDTLEGGGPEAIPDSGLAAEIAEAREVLAARGECAGPLTTFPESGIAHVAIVCRDNWAAVIRWLALCETLLPRLLEEDVAGTAAARIADLEHQLARTQARLAEELARRARREPA